MTETFAHNGYAVTLTEDYRFRVDEGDGRPAHFERARDARDAIDKWVKALAAQQRHSNKLALEAITEDGERCVIRGINLHTKELLGVPRDKARYGHYACPVYPPEPWIAATLKRFAMLKRERAAIDSRLRKFQIDRGTDGYGRLDADKHDEAIAEFTVKWTRLCQAAAAEAPKEP